MYVCVSCDKTCMCTCTCNIYITSTKEYTHAQCDGRDAPAISVLVTPRVSVTSNTFLARYSYQVHMYLLVCEECTHILRIWHTHNVLRYCCMYIVYEYALALYHTAEPVDTYLVSYVCVRVQHSSSTPYCRIDTAVSYCCQHTSTAVAAAVMPHHRSGTQQHICVQ